VNHSEWKGADYFTAPSVDILKNALYDTSNIFLKAKIDA